jgi:hypothetical protein
MAQTLTKRDIDPEAIYLAWTSGATELAPGKEVTFRKGQEFRGSAAIVLERPGLFVKQGTPHDEWPNEFAAADVSLAAVDREYRAEQARRAPPAIPVDQRVVATSTFRVGGRSFSEGNIYDLRDKVVKQNPSYFAWPSRPLVQP